MQLVDHTIWTGERETNNSTSIRKTSGKKIKKKKMKKANRRFLKSRIRLCITTGPLKYAKNKKTDKIPSG